MAKNVTGLTRASVQATLESTQNSPLIFAEDVRGAGVPNYTTTERDAIQGLRIDNNMVIYNTTNSRYETYASTNTRNSLTGVLTNTPAHWQPLLIVDNLDDVNDLAAASKTDAAAYVLVWDSTNSRYNITAITGGTGITVAGAEVSITDGGVGTTQLADDAVTNVKITDDTIAAAKLNVSAADPAATTHYVITKAADGAQSYSVANAGGGGVTDQALGELTDVSLTSPTDYDLLVRTPGATEAASDAWSNLTTTITANSDGVNELTHVFGMQLETPILFEGFNFAASNFVLPHPILDWDEPLVSYTVSNANNSDFQSVYADRIQSLTQFGTAVAGFSDTADTAFNATFTRTINAGTGTGELSPLDPRTGSYNGQAGGNNALAAVIETNEATPRTTTVTQNYSWRAASINFNNVSVPVATDQQVTSYTVNWSIPNTSDYSNVGPLTIDTLTGGTGVTDVVAAASGSQTFNSGFTIQHSDPAETISTSGATFTRPTTVSAESAVNRAVALNNTYIVSVAQRFPLFTVLDTTGGTRTFAVANLGTLSNAGYSVTGVAGITAARLDGNNSTNSAWRSLNRDFIANNSAGTGPATYHIVAPSALPATNIFRLPDSLNAPATLNSTTTVALGHTGSTVDYTVYSLTVAAGSTVTFRVSTA